MPFDTTDDGTPRPAPSLSDTRGLRSLQYRIVLLLVTFSVVLLPNILSYAAKVIGE